GLWMSRRGALGAPQPGPRVDAARPAATPDEATTEALRSLGYLAPGKDKSKGTKTAKVTPTPARTPKPAAARTVDARPSPSRTPAAASVAPRTPSVAPV